MSCYTVCLLSAHRPSLLALKIGVHERNISTFSVIDVKPAMHGTPWHISDYRYYVVSSNSCTTRCWFELSEQFFPVFERKTYNSDASIFYSFSNLMFIIRLAFDWVTRCYFRERIIDGIRSKMASAWTCLYVETYSKRWNHNNRAILLLQLC